MKSFLRIIFLILAVLIIGGIGGVLAERIVLPYLAHTAPFNKICWLKDIENGTTIVNKTEKIIIAENTAMEEAIDKIKPAIVGVVTKKITSPADKTEQIIAEGTGFILTADGSIITANHVLPAFKLSEQAKYYVIKDDKLISAQIVKRDAANNLALIKIQESNLPVVSLGNIEELRLGQRIVLVGAEIQKNIVSKFVNWGIIRNIIDNEFSINLEKEDWMFSGGPLMNIKAEVIGLVWLDNQGLIKIVTVDKIKNILK